MGTEPTSWPSGALGTPPAPGGASPAASHLRVGSVAGLRSLRAGLGRCLETAACPPATVADAQIVLAELATNAFLHDGAPLVEVAVSCDDDEIVISTWHRGDIPPPSFPVPPATASGAGAPGGGRGLAIVDRIVTSRDVESAAGCTTTVVRIPR